MKQLFYPRQFYLIAVIVFISVFLTSCLPDLKTQLQQSPVLQIDYWGTNWQQKPWQQRISAAPDKLVRYIHLDNEDQGYAGDPAAAEPMPEISMALESISSSLSPAINAMLTARLIGIFVVDNMGTSGMAEVVSDKDGNQRFGIIVLDKSILLKRKANEWATWREESAFRISPLHSSKLRMTIEAEKNNSIVNAIRFIILHELGHTLGIFSNAHPGWNDPPRPDQMNYPFVKLSWTMDEKKKVISLFDSKFPARKNIKYYAFGKAKLSEDQIGDVYAKMQQQTNFVSLYAATNLWDDFAETFVNYVHVVLERRPWEAQIVNAKGEVTVIRSCFEEQRCREKKEFMDQWFNNPLKNQDR
jgi:hypothetical protein